MREGNIAGVNERIFVLSDLDSWLLELAGAMSHLEAITFCVMKSLVFA